MRIAPLLTLLLASALCVLCPCRGPAADAADTDTSSFNTNASIALDAQQSYRQLQTQVHALQLALERNREDAQIAAQRNADTLVTSIQLLERSLSIQREGELETMQRTNHLTLLVAGSFAILVLVAMLLTACFQWRVAGRVAELSSVRPSLLALASDRALPEVAGGGLAAPNPALEEANARLLNVVEQLQQRILEYERAARPQLKKESVPAPARAGKA